jgi:hypothetical protein
MLLKNKDFKNFCVLKNLNVGEVKMNIFAELFESSIGKLETGIVGVLIN